MSSREILLCKSESEGFSVVKMGKDRTFGSI